MAESVSNCNEEGSSHIDLQHPELLSCDQLCHLFKKKRIPVEQDKYFNKEELLKLYYCTLMPLPQRNYKASRRGKLLTSKQEKLSSTATKCETSSQKSNSKIMLSRNLSSPLPEASPKSGSSSKSSHNLITFGETSVKLHSSPVNGLSKSGTPRRLSTTESTEDNSKRSKIIKLINSTITSNKNGSPVSCTNKRKSTPSDSKQETTAAAEESTPARKKHKPITWP